VTLERRNELVLAHMELVKKIAGSFLRKVPPSIELDDMVHEGLLGMIEAAGRWDEALKVPFKLYIKHRVRGAIQDSIRRRHYANATHAPLDEAPEPLVIPQIEQRIDRERRRERVAQVIEMLPIPQRQVVRRFYGEDQTNADIGRGSGVAARKVCEIHRVALVTMKRDLVIRGVRKAA
jgi:RNA polymerase sigma factor (sigma-70 family)